jgi:2'-hydroxyisoflavone reductase
MRDKLHGSRKATKSDARLHWAPTELLERFKVQPWSDMPVWVPGSGESAGFGRINIARALGAGLTFRTLKQTTVDTLEWFRSLPAERQSKLRAGIAPEREREVLAKLMRA